MFLLWGFWDKFDFEPNCWVIVVVAINKISQVNLNEFFRAGMLLKLHALAMLKSVYELAEVAVDWVPLRCDELFGVEV